MKDALRFMRLLKERIPPIPPTNHALLLDEDGRLMVSLSAFFAFVFSEEDMKKTPEELVEIVRQIWVRMPESKLKRFDDK